MGKNEMMTMGGYGFYVWTSVSLVIISLGWMAFHTRASFKQVQAKVKWSRDAQS
jgi:heme exporter protein CcmD